MALESGTRLGDYEILSSLGSGGMGEVYRARDTKLGREVAIKVLPEGFSDKPGRMARFDREAKVLASLNHSNIATLYGFESESDKQFLVMEVVEGETLSDRIKRGAIPVDEALALFLQIAEGLEAAHEKGVIHRDLKPANIKVSDEGQVKILDFGLAKVSEQDTDADSQAPTVTAGATVEGTILGTAAYMSPEQARGRSLDHRTDVWSFGCLLYEALVGQKAYGGETFTDTLAQIVDRDPDWEALPADTPAALRTLLRRCLEKDQHRRLPHIGSARLEIADALSGEPTTSGSLRAERAGSKRSILLAATVGAVGVALALTWLMTRGDGSPVSLGLTRLSISPSPGESWVISPHAPDLAISPDGERIAYIGRRGDDNHLILRRLDEFEGVSLGSFGGLVHHPFFSPDGEWVGFADGNVLKKAAVDGSTTVTVCVLPGYMSGASWGDDNTIIIGTLNEDLFRVSASGGEPEPIEAAYDKDRSVRWPEFLPGGRAVLFASSDGAGRSEVRVLSFSNDEVKVVVLGATFPRYARTGHLLYVADGVLWGVRFDVDQLETIGDPVPIVDGVMIKGPRRSGLGAADVGIAGNGTLVYRPSGAAGDDVSTLVWVDRNGREEPLELEAQTYGRMQLSPDGTRIAIEVTDANLTNTDIWVGSVDGPTLSQLTSDPAADRYPVWTPDGQRVIFASDRDGGGVLSKSADGRGVVEHLMGAISPPLYFVTPDGRDLVYLRRSESGELNLWGLSLDDARRDRRLELQPGPVAAISPNGRWLANSSDETGDFEVYVQPYPNPDGDKKRITHGGGRDPFWSRNGRELFYQTPTTMYAVAVTTEPSFRAAPAVALFDAPYLDSAGRWYDVAPDGRFLMLKPGWLSAGREAPIRVVLNWFEELERLLPTD